MVEFYQNGNTDSELSAGTTVHLFKIVRILVCHFIQLLSMDSADIPKCLEELLETAFLPKLKSDLDSIPIQKEHFAEYEKALKTHLPLIFDLLKQKQKEIEGNSKTCSLLILLCCELTAPETIFRLDDEHLLRHATRLLHESRMLLSIEVDELVFNYYQTRLKKDEWKRQLGAVHGFEQYLQVFYTDGKKLNNNWLSFCLSVALNIRDCSESSYKHLGVRVFLILLKHANPEDMRNLNIHSVIYDSVFKDVHLMESVPATTDIWNCLYLCLDFLQNIDSFNWSQVDELLEVLIRNVPLASNSPVSVCMLNLIPKFAAYFTLNREEFISKCNSTFEEAKAVEECCECCAGNTSYSCFRWAKSILELMVFESYKLMQDFDTCLELLRGMHRCYMVCILPIPLQVIEPHLVQFYEKFTSVLMEVIVTHKKEKHVIKLVKVFLNTFLWQLKYSSYVEQSSHLTTFRQAFQHLMMHPILS